MAKKKKWMRMAIFLFFVLFGAAAFPIYNLNKEYDRMLMLLIMLSAVVLYYSLGVCEKVMLPGAEIPQIILLNTGLVLLSMGCRYLWELEEVSNTYNFTVPNAVLHILAVLLVSTFAWRISKKDG